MSTLQYRPDIDGLRAVAVLAVVLYHFGIGRLHGGFVGVDVFFVISGYLIAGIIHMEILAEKFTLARFYERRARRIFPALFVVLLVTMLVGLFLLLPSDLFRLGRAAVATVLFVSNVQYMRESGYFDASSDFNPLLHTWSLGVEEQFYFAFPLILLLIQRHSPKYLGKILVICALLSFLLCVVVQPMMAKLVFFLSPFRAWELLLGALLGVGVVPAINSRPLRELTALIALIVLLVTIAFMKEGVDFPGWKATAPVLATAILLHTGQGSGTRCSRILSAQPLVFVGLISYSLYLWHWPILVFSRYREGMESLTLAHASALLALALFLSLVSYRYVEQPMRHWRKIEGGSSRRFVFNASAAGAVLLLAAGAGLMYFRGITSRVPPDVLALDRARSPTIPYEECDDKPIALENDACRIGAVGNSDLTLVWGDSWGMAWAPALDEVLTRNGQAGLLALRSACAPLLGVRNLKSPSCVHRNEEVLAWVTQHRPARVVLVAAWPMWIADNGAGYPLVDEFGETANDLIFERAYPRTIQALRKYVKDILVIGPTPGAANHLPYRMAMLRWRGGVAPGGVVRSEFESEVATFWRTVDTQTGGVRYVDPAPWFCNTQLCRQVDAQGMPLYRDGQHLSLAGAKYVAAWLARVQALPGRDTRQERVR